jgi:hypothetical protein
MDGGLAGELLCIEIRADAIFVEEHPIFLGVTCLFQSVTT